MTITEPHQFYGEPLHFYEVKALGSCERCKAPEVSLFHVFEHTPCGREYDGRCGFLGGVNMDLCCSLYDDAQSAPSVRFEGCERCLRMWLADRDGASLGPSFPIRLRAEL